MATSRQLHKIDTSKYIFLTFLILICLLYSPYQPSLRKKGSKRAQATIKLPLRPPAPAPAADKTFWNQQYLLGDWGGERTKLAEEKGVTFDFFYVADFLDTPQRSHQDRCRSLEPCPRHHGH